MSKREDYEARGGSILTACHEENHFELVDVEYVKEAGTWYLRAYIDKEGGFTVDDCEMVSRRLGDWLDKEDFIDESYILEVSSPGLGRPLKKEKDFKRSRASGWRSSSTGPWTVRRTLQGFLQPMMKIRSPSAMRMGQKVHSTEKILP